MQVTEIYEDDQITLSYIIECTEAEIRLLAFLTDGPLKEIIKDQLSIAGIPIGELKTPVEIHVALKKYLLPRH